MWEASHTTTPVAKMSCMLKLMLVDRDGETFFL